MSEGSTEEQAERAWGHPTGAAAPSSRGTGEGTAGWRRQSLLGLKPWWEAEAPGSALGAWGRSSFPLHGLTAAAQPPN